MRFTVQRACSSHRADLVAERLVKTPRPRRSSRGLTSDIAMARDETMRKFPSGITRALTADQAPQSRPTNIKHQAVEVRGLAVTRVLSRGARKEFDYAAPTDRMRFLRDCA